MHETKNIIGEVIEASTAEFTAESRELHSPPPFGSFVKAPWNGSEADIPPVGIADASDEDPFAESAGSFNIAYRAVVEGETPEEADPLPPAIYAVVYHASTTALDSGRRHRAYWKDEDQLRNEQPELGEWMLMTEFRAAIIGFTANGANHQILPPRPPRLHSAVEPCSPQEIRRITSRMDFLRTLANFHNAPTEEMVAACIREAHRAHDGSYDFLVSAGKELANLMSDDYDRLQAIMRRVAR